MNPYSNLAGRFFWSTAVAKKNMFDIDDLWSPKFRIERRYQIATYGSCFAQHIGMALHAKGFNWFIAEAAPQGLSGENARLFNYGVFSARTGNIYTVSLFRQWVSWASGKSSPPDEIWEKDGRFHDPFRPSIEPGGFLSAEELAKSRELAIEAFKRSLVSARVVVFTLGLTESWHNEQGGYEYPMCPGTVAGEFDPLRHKFRKQNYPFIRDTLLKTMDEIKELNPDVKFLLTVSPVPLTATMSGNHVLVATMESKSVLRAVAGEVADEYDYVDYFPSYEIINSVPFRGTFFEPNQRQVNHRGVDHVMSVFFRCLSSAYPEDFKPERKNSRPATARQGKKDRLGATERGELLAGEMTRTGKRQQSEDKKDVVCDEELLDAFQGSV